MTGIKSWFAGRSLREKRLLLVMAALAVLVVIWAGVIRPVGDGLAASRERYADATIRLGQTQAEIDALETARRTRPQPLIAPLADTVRMQADQAGFTLGSLDQEGTDRVRIAIPSARPGVLIGWINTLERGGVLVEQLGVTGNNDGTVAATMTLKVRAA